MTIETGLETTVPHEPKIGPLAIAYRTTARAVKTLEPIQKAAAAVVSLVAGAIALVAVLGTFIPPLGRFIDSITASRFGVQGYVYYQVALKDGRRTDDGPLFLLRPGNGTYKDIEVGDRLQATSTVNYRDQAETDKSVVMFRLYEKDCAIVLQKIKEVDLGKDKSAGWVRVATTNCGLFK